MSICASIHKFYKRAHEEATVQSFSALTFDCIVSCTALCGVGAPAGLAFNLGGGSIGRRRSIGRLVVLLLSVVVLLRTRRDRRMWDFNVRAGRVARNRRERKSHGHRIKSKVQATR